MAKRREKPKFKKNRTLELVRDIPEFETEYNKEKDKFNHMVYADAILKIIEDNEAPLAIGLLGSWGSGKSTILNLLTQKLESKNEYRCIYFNAWKYSGDSFRRQFIMECIDGLIEDEKEKERLKDEFKLRFLRDMEKELFSFKDLFKIQLKPNISMLISIIISLAVTIPFFIFGLVSKNTPLWLSSIIIALVIYILQQQIPKLFQVNVPMEIHPRIVLPEQFEEEFVGLIRKAKEKKLIFVIDDIDRCPSSMIMDILDSVKNFFAPAYKSKNDEVYKKCYFIIAMDDKAVVSVLKKERAREYEKEDVLKFFDVIVRLNPLRVGDLIEFAKTIAKETGVPQKVIQVAIYAGFDTPRKIKHFLNTFKTVYYVAEERYNKGIFPLNPNEETDTITKILTLQLVFPNEFKLLIGNPKIYEEMNKEAEKEFGTIKTGNRKKSRYPYNFLKFLWTTRDIPIRNIDAFIYLKLPEFGVKLPEFESLREAIINNEKNKISQIIKKIKDESKKDALKELIIHLLDIQPEELFLSNIVESAILIYKSVDFTVSQKVSLSNTLIRHIERFEKVLIFDPEIVFEMIENLREKEEYFNKITRLAVQDINEDRNPEYVSNFIQTLYNQGVIR
ncbi:MAG: hypothetical protein H0Z30_05880 [Candidatus Marinimicrobia bacterium]|nr:hypothetical protein [Candidatus Neomarinimicrobiota bacterium]